MKILIIGGSGFIGKRLYSIYSKDNVSKDIISLSSKDINLLSLESIKSFFRLIGNESVSVIYLASINRTIDDSWRAFDNNILMLRNFIECLVHINVKHFIYTSSVDVYGIPDVVPLDETSMITPISKYGLSKFCCENLFRIYNLNFPICILRLPGIYGDFIEDESVISIFINKIKTGKSIRIDGNGENLRDYVNIDDLVFLLRNFSINRIEGLYNLVTGNCIKINYIISLIKNFSKYPIDIEFNTDLSRNFDLSFDNSKLKSVIGNYTFISVEDGIAKYFK